MNIEVKLSPSQQRPLVEFRVLDCILCFVAFLIDLIPIHATVSLILSYRLPVTIHTHSWCPKAPFTLSPQMLFPENRCFTETFIQLQRTMKSCYRLEGRDQLTKRLCKHINLCSALDLTLFQYSGANKNESGSGRSREQLKNLKSSSARVLWATASSYKIPASCRLHGSPPLPSAFFVRNDYRSPVLAEQRLHPETTHRVPHLVCGI